MTAHRAPRMLTADLLVQGLAGLLIVWSVGDLSVATGRGHMVSVGVSVAFLAAIALGEFLRVRLPGDRDAAPIGTAAAYAFALLPGIGAASVHIRWTTVVVVVALGMAIGSAAHVAAGRAPRSADLGRRLIAVAVAALLFRTVPLAGGRPLVHAVQHWTGERWRAALVMVLVVLVASAVDSALAAALRSGRQHVPLARALVDEMTQLLGLGTAIGSTGVLIALAAGPMGLVALPVFVGPLMLTQFAVRRHATVRATYRQTIRSLSRLTELGGYTETGHSRRVARLALAIGRDLGVPERELLDLEYAALLHDIGQLSLVDPIPGGATVLADRLEQRRIADLGAAVVRQAGVLNTVATIVEHQSEPYRLAYEGEDDAVPMASRIVRVANAYDDLVGDSLEEGRRLAALERIHLSLAYEYDPRVVASLGRVVSREADREAGRDMSA